MINEKTHQALMIGYSFEENQEQLQTIQTAIREHVPRFLLNGRVINQIIC